MEALGRTGFKSIYLSMILAKDLDVLTTFLVLSSGGVELNPLMRPLLSLNPIIFTAISFDLAVVFSFVLLRGVTLILDLMKPRLKNNQQRIMMRFLPYLFSLLIFISFLPAINNFIVLIVMRS